MRPETIVHSGDPRVADYTDLRSGDRLRERGLFVVESRHVVRRLLQQKSFAVRSLLLTEAAARELAPAWAARAGQPSVYVASQSLIAELAGHRVHQGCLGLAERGSLREPNEVACAALDAGGLLLVLEAIANPDNVGAVFRNARAFGVGGAWLAGGGGDPLYRKAIRVSLGATLEVPFAQVKAWPDDLGPLREAGFKIVASVASPEAGAHDPSACRAELGDGPVALLLGGEGEGLTPGARAACDAAVRVPTAAGFDSLNVATASGILLHRLARLG